MPSQGPSSCSSSRSVFLWFQGEDLDFWLSTTPPAATPALEELEVNTTVTVLKEGQEEPRGEEQDAEEDREQDLEKVGTRVRGLGWGRRSRTC